MRRLCRSGMGRARRHADRVADRRAPTVLVGLSPQLSEPEIVHGKGLYRPYCDSFWLSFRLSISLEEMIEVAQTYGGLPAVAMINDRAVDAGQHMVGGETVTLSFGERQGAISAAGLLGASPSFREADDSWREDARQQQLALLEELFANPDELRRFASKHELVAENLNRDQLAAELFCP